MVAKIGWKTKNEASVTCPKCKSHLVVKMQEKLVQAAVPAEKDERTVVELSTQTTLKEPKQRKSEKVTSEEPDAAEDDE